MPIVSVIIPVFNVSQYLHRSIESVMNQKNNDWELLLIDDGSTDGSNAICDEYANEQIKVFHTENKGVSHARNVGLNHAKGEFIAFVDADDWIDSDFLSIKPTKETDIIEKQSIRHHEDGKDEICIIPDTYCDISDKDLLYYRYVHDRNNAIWDKIIRRNTIGNTRFNEQVKKGEDFQFFLSIINRIRTYSYSRAGFYHYYHRTGSAMSYYGTHIREDLVSRIRNMNYVKEILNTGKQEKALGNCIVYGSYLPSIYELKEHLTSEEKHFLRKEYIKLFTRRMTYFTMKERYHLYRNAIRTIMSL